MVTGTRYPAANLQSFHARTPKLQPSNPREAESMADFFQ